VSHANAALTPRARLRLAVLIVDHGWPVARAAERYDVSWPTAKRWADRYRRAGAAGMTDRSSRPHRVANRTPAPMVRKIVHLRWKQRLSPLEIGARLDLAPSTVHAVLVRCRLNRLWHIDRRTGEQIRRRYEHDRPGALLHVDVKKLGNIPDGGGWRYVGRQQGKRNRTRTPDAAHTAHRDVLMGTAFVHTVIDDHSRVAYAEIHDDETSLTAAAVLRVSGGLVRRSRSHRGTSALRQRQLLPVPALARGLRRTRRHPEEDSPLPAADKRQGRTLPPNPGRRLGLQPLLRQRISSPQGPARMAPPLQPPPTPHRNRQGPTHHPLDQRGWAVQLARLSGKIRQDARLHHCRPRRLWR